MQLPVRVGHGGSPVGVARGPPGSRSTRVSGVDIQRDQGSGQSRRGPPCPGQLRRQTRIGGVRQAVVHADNGEALALWQRFAALRPRHIVAGSCSRSCLGRRAGKHQCGAGGGRKQRPETRSKGCEGRGGPSRRCCWTVSTAWPPRGCTVKASGRSGSGLTRLMKSGLLAFRGRRRGSRRGGLARMMARAAAVGIAAASGTNRAPTALRARAPYPAPTAMPSWMVTTVRPLAASLCSPPAPEDRRLVVDADGPERGPPQCHQRKFPHPGAAQHGQEGEGSHEHRPPRKAGSVARRESAVRPAIQIPTRLATPTRTGNAREGIRQAGALEETERCT